MTRDKKTGNIDIAIYITFFWYGFSLVLYLFAFIRRANTVNKEQKISLPPFQVLLIIMLGLIGVFGLAFLLGIYNQTEEYINQIMLAGGLVGFLVSKILFGINTESSKK